ncbi:rhodanese-like domain-containing protein [Streptosporangium roseum]|uniref:Rhodanese-related sulfurtransferase-like protein n=1 Tax=Streptosporangium roseum (strain ATCC 12428 / DSM 43021 / JCM 3005 / KCTC 9067 / NCIMB 10171 / NRRL 2505 / NI 9100) TaxID=479432 RepID=D2AUM7_STRRD|nr:rhodanese-like domain-containing protein [Streptosporangium roseum]ACZ84889.1 Rhodanese-related sulfurtransferase-like protein [Streptosporangium roseum DSM 43021]
MSVKTSIDVPAARALIAADPGVLVVDVRTPGEFASAHISGAVNLPLDQVDTHLRRIVADAGGTMLLICQSGGRATRAHTTLTRAGLVDVVVLEGGMNAWTGAGAPTTSTSCPIPGTRARRWGLERQVRLVAGGIVATSVLASIRWPQARFIAGFVGAGLTFAAVTDTCAMGMALAKLPYNRTRDFDIDAVIARLRGGEARP